MKTRIFFFIGLLLLYIGNISINKVAAQENKATGNTINIVSSPELYELTNNWTNEFCKLNPEIKIKVIKFSDAQLSNIVNAGGNLCFVTQATYASLNKKELWKMGIGKDVLVPIINSKNPFLSEIQEQNISPVILAQILMNPKDRKWNVVPKIRKSMPINYYMVNDPFEKSLIASFLSANQPIEGTIIENYEKLITAVGNDPYSIGFCKLSTLMNSNDPGAYGNISIIPVDRNGNGKIDEYENVYSDLQTFTRKAWIGPFPKQLNASIYSVASREPTNQNELALLKWISTDGQSILNQNGYSSLVSAEKQSNLAMLGYTENSIAETMDSSLFSSIAQFFSSISLSLYVFALFIFLLIVFGIFINITSRNKAFAPMTNKSSADFDENSLVIPTSLFFDKTHTWAFMEKDGNVRIGIDDFIQHITGPLTKVKMKNPGEIIKKGEPILAIAQNGKQLCINSPVSGKIIAQNELLETNPETINQSPYSKGWVYMIEPTNWLREIQFFTMTEKYKEWIKNEFSRLKDFLSITLNAKMPEYAHVVLQDGGVVKDNVLADLGPEIWEEFQTNFIDTMK